MVERTDESSSIPPSFSEVGAATLLLSYSQIVNLVKGKSDCLRDVVHPNSLPFHCYLLPICAIIFIPLVTLSGGLPLGPPFKWFPDHDLFAPESIRPF